MRAAEHKNRKASFIEIMKHQILSGERRPGDWLPPERECTRLACAKLTTASLQTLQAHTEAIYAADDAQAAEAVYLYHKCLIEISGNLAYAMVFQSFGKMIRNLLQEHYKNREELRLSIPKFQMLTAA